MKQKKIAFIYTWPNSKFKNAEYEVLKRIEIAAKNINQPLDIISAQGYILDSEFFETKTKINESDYEFMVSVHYDDIKMLDIFSYYTLWVPPEITMQYTNYNQIKKNVISNDDFIVHDSGGMYNHLKTYLYDTNRTIDGASSLTASLPITVKLEPKLNDPHLFYCGINWERLIKSQIRHAKLFDYFNSYKYINIFGPKQTWKGCKRYKGTIPFDGVSILSEINKSGIVLALSSNVHYRAGSATNRIYEGCAGGAVIISDTNPYIVEHFGDSVLYFDFDKEHPEKMFNQIQEHVKWIRENPDKALELAQKSQKIFLEEYSLEKQLECLIKNHKNRQDIVRDSLYSRMPQNKTLAIYTSDFKSFNSESKNLLANTVHNIEKQQDKNIILAIACDLKQEEEIKNYIKQLQTNIEYKIFPYKIYDEFFNKQKTRGEIFCDIIRIIKHDYFIILNGNEGFFKDHITTLKRTLEDHPSAEIAYSGSLVENTNGNFSNIQYAIRNNAGLFKDINNETTPSGIFLLKASVEKYIPDYVFTNIDGCEINAIVNVTLNRKESEIAFSKRITNRTKAILKIKNTMVVPCSYQLNLINGLSMWSEEEFASKNCLSDGYGKINQINRFLRKYLNIKIILQYIGLLFAYNKSQTIRNKKRISAYKNVQSALEIHGEDI